MAFLELYPSQRLSVVFSDGTSAADCPRETYGDCTVRRCALEDAAEDVTRPTAGIVSYESPGLGRIEATPQADGTYSSTSTGLTGNFAGDEEGWFRAAGGEVPAFEQRVDFPILPLLESPIGTEGEIVVPKNDDLLLTWSRGVADMVIMVQPVTRPEGGSFSCRFDAVSGQATIPSAALSLLPSGGGVHLFGLTSATIQAGDYQVSLLSGSWLRTPDREHAIRMTVE